jgi:hypothetical protein
MQQAQVRVFESDASTQLTDLRTRARELELRRKSSEMLQQQIRHERDQAAPAERPMWEQRLSEARMEFVNTTAQLDATNAQIRELESSQNVPRVGVTVQPPAESFPRPQDLATIYMGGVVLLLPLVLTLARRLWVRGIRRESLDLENSPRLQRIEQAIESIAVEVERIGEAQRFTTKLFAERQLDAAPRIPVQPRREPGTITPH